MRGSNNISDADLWKGTSKAAKGHLAHVLFRKAKEEGMVVARNWQDADSSSAKSFRHIFPDGALSQVMLCGGHVGRVHGNNLKEYKAIKILGPQFIAKHKDKYPDVAKVKCLCASKKHSRGCGCITDGFIINAKKKHFCALKQCGNTPEDYASRMRILGKYHAKDVHMWKDEDSEEQTCPWHPQKVCSFGKCGKEGRVGSTSGREGDSSDSLDEEGSEAEEGSQKEEGSQEEEDSEEEEEGSEEVEDSKEEDSEEEDSDEEEEEEFSCEGKEYSTRGEGLLKCPLHSLLYEIECDRMARKAEEVIDREMGRGHSNLPESKFHVLTKFRAKDVNLHQLHY